MPRYHFHLRDGGRWTADSEGLECPDLEAAAAKATHKARAELKLGSLQQASVTRVLDCSIVVADETGRLLLAVPCYEAAFLPGFQPLRL